MIYSKIVNKLRRRRLLTCFALATLGVYIVMQTLSPDLDFQHWGPLDNISCHYIETDATLPYADNDNFVPPSRSIFFHETSCKGSLDPRQACAVESAARAHPNWQVNVLFAAPVPELSLKTGSLSVLRNFSNIKLARVHVIKYARKTPLETMVSGGALNRTRWRIIHTSDVLRYLSLYKFGGVYLDLDVVVAKALDPLVRNWAARESDMAVAAGALAFSKDELGRSVAEAAIQDIKNYSRSDVWGHTGPGVITRVLQRLCSTSELLEMSAATCNGFEVYGPQFFYPVVYREGYEYFSPGEIKEGTAYIFHVWNKLTGHLDVDKDSAYAKLARKYCPSVYKFFEDDNKPQHICGDCKRTVRQAARLKQTAETTQWRLQQELEMVADSASDWSEGPELHGGYFKADDAEVGRQWACGKCRAAFSTQEEFTAHEQLRSCRTQLSYVCETCGLELKSMSRLKRHRLTHTGLLPHACAACPYRARTAHALAVHARAHSGARPARCALCPAAFASASNLASHRRSHLPPRHHCDLCRKGFKFKVALQNHMASQHSNAKPYNCNICAKTFSTRKMILRHEIKAHNRPKMRSGVLPTYMRLREDS